MEEERELISPDDEASDGHQEIASLFEQTILLVGQAFNSVAYQRRLNVLNTLIDNSVKVKEILKEPMLDHSHKKRIVWKHGPNWPFYALMLRTKLY